MSVLSEEIKRGWLLISHPRVLTQRTPVLRSGVILSLLGAALLSAALLGAAFCAALLGAALLCSCHNCASPFFKVFSSHTRYCSSFSLVYYSK